MNFKLSVLYQDNNLGVDGLNYQLGALECSRHSLDIARVLARV